MSPLALLLVLVAAVLHATWNIVAKRANGGDHFVLWGSILTGVLWAPPGLWLAVPAVPSWGPWTWALVIGSGVVHLLYFRVLLAGYRASDLTVVYPVARGTGPLLSSLAATALFGEELGASGVLGVTGITAGVMLVAGGSSLWATLRDPVRGGRARAGLAWGAATGLLIATYTLLDGWVVKRLGVDPLLCDWIGNLVRIPLMLPAVFRDPVGFRSEVGARWGALLVLATLAPAGYVLVLHAARMAPLSHVAPAREVSMLFAALVGGKLLGEGDRAARVAGAAFIAAGVMALAWG